MQIRRQSVWKLAFARARRRRRMGLPRLSIPAPRDPRDRVTIGKERGFLISRESIHQRCEIRDGFCATFVE
jgi:hypothetical protein